jgi:hypothetical protein
VLLVLMGPIGLVLVGFLSYLGFLGFVVVRTGRTDGLRDVAEAVKAYRGVLSLLGRSAHRDLPPSGEYDSSPRGLAAATSPSPDARRPGTRGHQTGTLPHCARAPETRRPRHPRGR